MKSAHAPAVAWSNLDLRQIRAFAAVATTGSFTRAGALLNLTQSAISHSIRALEEHVGAPLFVRGGKAPTLTREGNVLHNRALKVLAELDGAQRDLSRLRNWDHALVRAGIASSLCALALPSVLREFRESFPAADIRIVPGDSPALLAALQRREIDLAITLRPDDTPCGGGLVEKELFRDQLQLVFSPRHALAGARPMETQALASQRIILYGGKTVTGDLCRRWIESEVAPMEAPLELNSVEAMRELAIIHFGVALLPAWAVRREVADGLLMCADLPGATRLQRTWSIFTREGDEPDLPTSIFLGIFSNVCRSM